MEAHAQSGDKMKPEYIYIVLNYEGGYIGTCQTRSSARYLATYTGDKIIQLNLNNGKVVR